MVTHIIDTIPRLLKQFVEECVHEFGKELSHNAIKSIDKLCDYSSNRYDRIVDAYLH